MSMSILDGILGKVTEHVDVNNLAEKLGLNPGQVEGAIASLAKSHTEDGDTVTLAAEKTGIDSGKLTQIVEQIGGEGSLARFNEILKSDEGLMGKVSGFLDRDGDGNPLNDLTSMAKGLFGKS
jgi:ATP phosphoribosyltransferase regulatory subunit HisZ